MPLPDGRPTAMERSTTITMGSHGTTGKEAYGDSRYQLSPRSFAHAKAVVVAASRRSRRRALALAAQVTYLAVMDPESGASTQDRLKAADGAARVSGLVRDESRVVFEHRVSFRGLARGLPSVTREAIEARVVEATALPPAGPTGLPTVDGATAPIPGGGGGGG